MKKQSLNKDKKKNQVYTIELHIEWLKEKSKWMGSKENLGERRKTQWTGRKNRIHPIWITERKETKNKQSLSNLYVCN